MLARSLPAFRNARKAGAPYFVLAMANCRSLGFARDDRSAGLSFVCQHGYGEVGENVVKFQPATLVGLEFFAGEDVCELHGRLIG